MLFAGASDTMLKKQAISGYSQGQFMAIAGIVWSSVFIISALISGQSSPSWVTVRWTLTIGILSAFANYLLIYSMRTLEAGVATTIYRLNLAFAAIIAFIFLAEPVNVMKISGLFLACASVFCFVQHQQKIVSGGIWLMVLIVIIASLMRAVYGISYKIALDSDVQYLWFLSGPGLGWTVLGAVTALKEGNLKVPASNILRGTITGFLLCGLVYFFAKALEYGQASIIIPVSQMGFVVTALLAWLFLGEKFTVRKVIGLSFACLSIAFLSLSG
jgi:drug/metabolite transporter (DMT)-like permease